MVDFYCPEENLVVGLDGEVHFEDEAVEYDKKRTMYLKSLELRIVRFVNQGVLRRLIFN